MNRLHNSLIILALVAMLTSSCMAADRDMDRFCVGIPNGRFVNNPRSCQHWIFCNNQVAIEGVCEGIFYFDLDTQMCRYPLYVDCQFDAVDVVCDTMGMELHPHPQNCGQYVVCLQGFPRVINCAPDLHWNPESNQCDIPANAQCPHWEGEILYTCDPTRNYLALHPLDCQKYFICIGGSKQYGRCADGLRFDPENARCDLADRVPCINAPEEPEWMYECDPNRDFYYAPHPRNCNYYFICMAGLGRLASCAPGLMFDWITLRCQLEQNAHCLAPRLA